MKTDDANTELDRVFGGEDGVSPIRFAAERSAGAAQLDAQTSDLLEACYERNIHSRGDMKYAFQPWALDPDRLRDALLNADRDRGGIIPETDEQIDHYTAMAIAVAAEYARLAEGTDR